MKRTALYLFVFLAILATIVLQPHKVIAQTSDPSCTVSNSIEAPAVIGAGDEFNIWLSHAGISTIKTDVSIVVPPGITYPGDWRGCQTTSGCIIDTYFNYQTAGEPGCSISGLGLNNLTAKPGTYTVEATYFQNGTKIDVKETTFQVVREPRIDLVSPGVVPQGMNALITGGYFNTVPSPEDKINFYNLDGTWANSVYRSTPGIIWNDDLINFTVPNTNLIPNTKYLIEVEVSGLRSNRFDFKVGTSQKYYVYLPGIYR